MLGETPLTSVPAVPRSVFDYMSQKDRERIQTISSSLTRVASTETEAPLLPLSTSVTKLEPHIAQAALRGFQPFTANPSKQARYNTYLQSQASPDGSTPSLKPVPGQNSEEFNKELEDYAKAASLFKPMTGAMAGRFTSAAVVDSGPKIHEGLHTPSHEDIAAKEAQQRKEEEDRVSPKVHAANVGMYGQLTRERKPWQPAKLLCKRFGVKDPNPEPELSTEPVASSSRNAPSFTPGEVPTPQNNNTLPSQTHNGPHDLDDIGLEEDETQDQDTLTYQRPSMDIFKAIFASDDEDSDDENSQENGDEPPVPAPTTNTTNASNGFISARSILEDTPVDIDTFKPKFIPREGKGKQSNDEEKVKEKKERKERKEKKEKKKKEKKNVLVSFEMEEDASEVKQPKDWPKKRRKTPIGSEDKNDQAMWEAKPPAETEAPPIAVPALISDASTSEVGPKGRKRAVDFM